MLLTFSIVLSSPTLVTYIEKVRLLDLLGSVFSPSYNLYYNIYTFNVNVFNSDFEHYLEIISGDLLSNMGLSTLCLTLEVEGSGSIYQSINTAA